MPAGLFQSAPGLTVGRCAQRLGVLGGGVGVSIRARPHGRAMPFGPIGGRPVGDVSIRARPHGRAMPPASLPAPVPGAVSIRARPHGRAMPISLIDITFACAFQSAPGLTVGRCVAAGVNTGAVTLFQSAPGLTVGRCPDNTLRYGSPEQFQSAPGLTVGRCAGSTLYSFTRFLFQSAPGLTVGRCRISANRGHAWCHVSIRARPHGRAMQAANKAVLEADKFQSAPGLTVGRCAG